MPEPTRWPASLWLVRHGLSAGNIADEDAHRRGLHELDIDHRDMDIPLSPIGEQQARMTGAWIGTIPVARRPRHTLASPYVRAEQTAHLLLEASGCPPDCVDVVLDERLREREFGILDRLTTMGIENRFPEQAAARAFLGKFYHRPPGGESWADVSLRLRSALDTIGREYPGEHLLVVTHQVAIMVFRYLLERLREQELLDIDRANPIANCSVTVYEYDADLGPNGGMALRRFNELPPGEPVTEEE